MAEALVKHKYPEVDVQSAGVLAGSGQAANDHAVEALKQQGISCNHTSQPVTRELLNWADLILTMTEQHRQMLITEYPQMEEKAHTLRGYAFKNNKSVDIKDPIGSSIETYEATLKEMEEAVDEIFTRQEK